MRRRVTFRPIVGARLLSFNGRSQVRLPGWKAVMGKAAYGLACVAAVVALATSGFAYYATNTAESFGTSRVLAGGPSTGAMNILIMGLESRTYWDGTPLDHHLQYMLNLGSIGGEETNTLILMHIFAGGHKAVAFSIPRDDYVTMYGTLGYAGTPPQNKIDDAYNAAMQQELINDRSQHPNWTSAQDNLRRKPVWPAGGGRYGRGADRGHHQQVRRAQPDRLL